MELYVFKASYINKSSRLDNNLVPLIEVELIKHLIDDGHYANEEGAIEDPLQVEGVVAHEDSHANEEGVGGLDQLIKHVLLDLCIDPAIEETETYA